MFSAEMVQEPVNPTPSQNVQNIEEDKTTEAPKLNVIPKILTLITGLSPFPKSAKQKTEEKSLLRSKPYLRTNSEDSADASLNPSPSSEVHDVTFASQGTYPFFELFIFSTVRYYYFPILLQRWTGYFSLCRIKFIDLFPSRSA